jgi:hypothetical protein
MASLGMNRDGYGRTLTEKNDEVGKEAFWSMPELFIPHRQWGRGERWRTGNLLVRFCSGR